MYAYPTGISLTDELLPNIETFDLGIFGDDGLPLAILWKYFKKKNDIAIFIAKPNIEPRPLIDLYNSKI